MRTRLLCLLPFLLLSCATEGEPDTDLNLDGGQAVQVMVLGTFHFKGSDADVINVDVGSVLTPQRQLELQNVAQALATFEPTIVVSERVTPAPDYLDPVYRDFDNNMLASNANERVQIAYRVAQLIGLENVHGIDEQPEEGEPDYFPFAQLVQHAEATGQADALNEMIGTMRTRVEAELAATENLSMATRLKSANESFISSPEFYYRLSEFDIGEAQPGAELQAYWFMRNAKIFSKIADISQPGDRVLVVYGAGHKFWLEHMAAQTPGYLTVDPVPYLRKAE